MIDRVPSFLVKAWVVVKVCETNLKTKETLEGGSLEGIFKDKIYTYDYSIELLHTMCVGSTREGSYKRPVTLLQ